MTYAVGQRPCRGAVYQRFCRPTPCFWGSSVPPSSMRCRRGPCRRSTSCSAREDARDLSSATHGGAVHRFTVTIVAGTGGFSAPRRPPVPSPDALVDADLGARPGDGLVSLRFLSARARRTPGGSRAPH